MARVLPRAIMSALFIALSSSTLASAADNQTEWHWIIVTPDDQNNWTVRQGIGSVTLRGDRLDASLDDGDVLLKGTIRGHRVTAVETLVGTDASPRRFNGEILRFRSRLTDPANGRGSDRISLYAANGFYIGLFRRVRSGAKPGQ